MELSVIDKKLAMDSRDIAKLTHKQHKIYIIYSKNEYEAFIGNDELPVYNDPVPEGDVLLEDSRYWTKRKKLEHQDFLKVLAAYCNCEDIKNADFVMLESDFMTEMLLIAELRKETLSKNDVGFVYIIYDNTNLNTKIGKARDVNKRLKSLRCANPNLKLYGYMQCNNYSKVEFLLHKHFKTSKISGEFFYINPKTAFEELCKLDDEYGYHEVNPVCIEASNIVYSAKTKIRTI